MPAARSSEEKHFEERCASPETNQPTSVSDFFDSLSPALLGSDPPLISDLAGHEKRRGWLMK